MVIFDEAVQSVTRYPLQSGLDDDAGDGDGDGDDAAYRKLIIIEKQEGEGSRRDVVCEI